jgi:hypothetical protein
MLVRQDPYLLNHTPSLFYFSYISDRVCAYAWAGMDLDLPIYALVGMTGDGQVLLVERSLSQAQAGLQIRSS